MRLPSIRKGTVNRRWHTERLEARCLLSSSGDVEWLRQFGSLAAVQFDDPVRAVVTDGGNVYVTGDGVTGGPFVRKYDGAGNELWTRQISAGFGRGAGIAVDSSGIYVTGWVGDGALPGQTSAGGADAFVRKYDADGNELWTRQFGTTEDDFSSAIATDASGVYVAGSIAATLPGQVSSGSSDAFVRKYDAAGTELWTRQFGTTGADGAQGINANDSGVYVAGIVAGALPGQTSAGRSDAFVRKYDDGGTVLWSRQFGTFGADAANCVAVDASGVYVGGSVGGRGSNGLGGGGALPGQTSAGGQDAFLRKYNPAGDELWTRQFGTLSNLDGGGDFEGANGISVDASGVYVGGIVNGSLPGQMSAGPRSDAFLRRYDASGSEVWTRQFGTFFRTGILGVAVDPAAGLYAVGETDGVLPDAGGGVEGSPDSFVRRYDAGGSELWTRQFGPRVPGIDFARAVDADGNVYVAGTVEGYLPGQVASGGIDAFVRKYDADGNELWTRQFGAGFFHNNEAAALAVDSSGVYVAGSTDGTFAGPPGTGGRDAFVRKYDADGNELWTRQFGTDGTDAAAGIAAGATGVYVTGSTSGAFPGATSAGGQDAFVREYDGNGNVLWTGQFGSPGDDDAVGVAVNASGVYLAGKTSGTLPGQSSLGGADAFVRKYDATGNLAWIRQFGSDTTDHAFGVATDASGVYVSGSTDGALPGQASAGLTDAFVRKYDVSGAEVWTRQFGTSENDQALGVAAGSSDVYVAGSTDGALPGQASAGFTDAFVCKYDSGGGDVWTFQFGTAGADSAAGIAVGISGLYVAGSTTGTFPGQDSGGAVDPFVAKIMEAVQNTPPSNVVLTPSDSSIRENGTLTLNGAFTDPDAADTHVVVIDWGAGEGTTTLELAAGVTTFAATHSYPDDNPTGTAADVYAVSATVTEPAGGTASSDSSVFSVNNVAPTISGLGFTPNPINENGTVTLTGSFTDPGTQDVHTVVITWGPGEGATTVNLAAGTFTFGASHQYLDDNPTGTTSDIYPISVTVTDDDTGIDTAGTSVTVKNLAPQVQLAGSSFSGVRGQSLSFAGSFSDVGTLDTHTVSWDFGDQTSTGFIPANAPGALAPIHSYSAAGTYTIALTVRDDDGGEATVSGAVTILDGQLQPDPCDPELSALVVTGTSGDDTMIINPGSGGTVQVMLNGTVLGSFTPTGQIIAYGLAGDDNIQVAGAIGHRVWLYGDAGNDRLNAGNGGGLLFGGDGNDDLMGNGGRDVMIGGEGADRLIGNSDDDILVAGYTTNDDRALPGHNAFWCAVVDEWTSGNTFAARVRNLKDGLGGNAHNGASFLLPNVRDDRSADALDFLNGSAGDDWVIFQTAEDKVSGQVEAAN